MGLALEVVLAQIVRAHRPLDVVMDLAPRLTFKLDLKPLEAQGLHRYIPTNFQYVSR